MKKIISLTFALLLVCASAFSAACKEEENSSTGGGSSEGGSSIVQPGEDYDPRDPEQYIYKGVFANSPYKDQWDTGYGGADLYGIWDQSVLPNGFPTKPDSVTDIDRTSYVGVADQKLHQGGRQLGLLWVDDTDYEQYYVMFTGTEQTFNEITAQLEQNFVCFDDREDNSWYGSDRVEGYFHAFSNDWYLYLSYGEDRDWLDNGETVLTGEWSFTLYALPAYHQRPKVVQDVDLPQFGFVVEAVNSIQSWSEGDDDVEWLDYDYQTGIVTGTIGQYWSSGKIRYYGVTETQIQSYVATLVAEGFEQTQKGDNEYGQLYWTYKKGDLKVLIDLYVDSAEMVIDVQLGDVWYY